MEVRILLVGNLFDHHICRFIKNLRQVDSNNEILIDIYSIYYDDEKLPEEAQLFNNVLILKKHFNETFYKTRLAKNIFYLVDLIFGFKNVPFKYDMINIHYLTYFSFFLWPLFRKKSNSITITPWGSDIYKVKGYKKYLCEICLANTDFITMDDSIRFESDLIRIFGVNKNKFIRADFGSDIIDYAVEFENQVSKKDAKFNFGLSETDYVITCGYNSNPAQNHLGVIHSINKVKSELPVNSTLFFPLTYGRNEAYIKEIEELLNNYKLRYIFFDKYLSISEMYLLQRATDLFVHVQTTDGYSSSLQEYLLNKAVVINGGWLKYPSLEKYGVPYYVTNSLDDLPNVILEAVYNTQNICPTKELMNFISNLGWATTIQNWKLFYLGLLYE